ncbi:MAG: hypothetical protein ACK58L_11585 [Planctomycetota bacterium]
MIYLAAIFTLLIAGWMLFAWIIGESCDIRWLRNWCAGIFVTMAIVVCTSGGFYLTYKVVRTSHRSSVQQFALLLKERLDEGRISDVRDAVEHLAVEPSDGSGAHPDILQRLADLTEALESTRQEQVTAKDVPLH